MPAAAILQCTWYTACGCCCNLSTLSCTSLPTHTQLPKYIVVAMEEVTFTTQEQQKSLPYSIFKRTLQWCQMLETSYCDLTLARSAYSAVI